MMDRHQGCCHSARRHPLCQRNSDKPVGFCATGCCTESRRARPARCAAGPTSAADQAIQAPREGLAPNRTRKVSRRQIQLVAKPDIGTPLQ